MPPPHPSYLLCSPQRAAAKKRKAKAEEVKDQKKTGKALKAPGAAALRKAAAVGKRRVGRPAKADSLGRGSVPKEKVAKKKEVDVVSPDGQGASKTFLHWVDAAEEIFDTADEKKATSAQNEGFKALLQASLHANAILQMSHPTAEFNSQLNRFRTMVAENLDEAFIKNDQSAKTLHDAHHQPTKPTQGRIMGVIAL
jgi:hypothetical protein